VLIHRVETSEQLGEPLGTDRKHGRQLDRRIQRVATARPLPEPEHVVGVDPELGDLLGVGGDGHEVLGDRPLVAQR
jgi:hypothetical protein